MLTTLPFNDYFDLQPWVGQRAATFRFHRINGLTGQNMGDLTPLQGSTLTHDTTRTIKRQLTLNLGVADTAAINPLVDRVDVSMLAAGAEWPLGRYMFTDQSAQKFTSGRLASVALNDEMFLVDQELVVGLNGVGQSVQATILNAVTGLPITTTVDPSPYICAQAWSQGSMRGQVLEALSITGDYFSPWFGNDKQLHFIRSFNPTEVVPQFDYDAGSQVLRAGIVETSNLLTAPNRFQVISNTSATITAVTAVATVPPSSPNSFENRGFYITQTVNLQLTSQGQAQGVASNLSQRQQIFETTQLSTPPDPRHDSYDVIKWQGFRWLELGWSMDLVEGGRMSHTLRKAYSS